MAREIRCFQDCPAQWTGDPKDCTCAEVMAELYDREMENRVDRLRDAWVEGDK